MIPFPRRPLDNDDGGAGGASDEARRRFSTFAPFLWLLIVTILVLAWDAAPRSSDIVHTDGGSRP